MTCQWGIRQAIWSQPSSKACCVVYAIPNLTHLNYRTWRDYANREDFQFDLQVNNGC